VPVEYCKTPENSARQLAAIDSSHPGLARFGAMIMTYKRFQKITPAQRASGGNHEQAYHRVPR